MGYERAGALAAICAGLLLPAPALGCRCRPAPERPVEAEVREAVGGSVAVFQGRVVKDAPTGAARRVTLEVTRVWRGPARRRLIVLTPAEAADCGFPFHAGEEYLVYASGTAPSPGGGTPDLQVDLCGRTRSTELATRDLTALSAAGLPVKEGAELVSEPWLKALYEESPVAVVGFGISGGAVLAWVLSLLVGRLHRPVPEGP